MEQDCYLSWLLHLPEANQKLLSAIVGLVRAAVENSTSTDNTAPILSDALLSVKDGSEADCEKMLQAVRQEKDLLAPDCALCANPCGRTMEYPMAEFCSEDPALQAQKARMLHALMENPSLLAEWEGTCRRLFLFGYEKDAEQFASFLQSIN